MNIKKITIPVLICLFLFVSNITAGEKVKLSLDLEKVSGLALTNNLDIQIAKFDAYIKRNDIYDAVSVFDTILNVGVNYEDDQRQRTSTLSGTKSKTTDYTFDLSKKLNTGTTLGVGFEHTRDWSNSSFATTNPSHESQASVSLEQEIGKNFFGLIDRNEVKITKLDIENSDYSSLDKIEENLADAQKAYWKVVLNKEKVKIREEMLDRATSLYKIYIQKVNIGLAENPDLYAAEANMNIRKNQLIQSENDLKMAENALLLKLNLINDNEDFEIVADDDLDVEGAEERSFIQSLKLAIENRRDYRQSLNEVESKKLNLVIKKNSMWPEIDLEATFVRNGVAQYYKDAMGNITDSDNPMYYFGFKLKYPLENSSAKGEYKSAKFDKAKSLVLLKKVEREILVEIDDAVRTINTTLEKVLNSYKIKQLQQAKLEEQEKRFKLGRSDSDTLIRFYDDLLDAQISLIDSLYQFYSDLIDLELKENTLLLKHWESTL